MELHDQDKPYTPYAQENPYFTQEIKETAREAEKNAQEKGEITQEKQCITQENIQKTKKTTQEKGEITQETKEFPPKKQSITQEKQHVVQENTPEKILEAIRNNPRITRRELAVLLDRTEDSIKYQLLKLTRQGIIKHIGATKAGEWVILNENR